MKHGSCAVQIPCATPKQKLLKPRPKLYLNIIAAVVQEKEVNATEPNGVAENGHLPNAAGQKPDKQAERHMCCGMRHAATEWLDEWATDAYVHACIAAGGRFRVRHRFLV